MSSKVSATHLRGTESHEKNLEVCISGFLLLNSSAETA